MSWVGEWVYFNGKIIRIMVHPTTHEHAVEAIKANKKMPVTPNYFLVGVTSDGRWVVTDKHVDELGQ